MTPGYAAVRPSDPAAAALDLMANEAAHRILVLDDAGALVGVVTAGDLLRALLPPGASH